MPNLFFSTELSTSPPLESISVFPILHNLQGCQKRLNLADRKAKHTLKSIDTLTRNLTGRQAVNLYLTMKVVIWAFSFLKLEDVVGALLLTAVRSHCFTAVPVQCMSKLNAAI